MIKAKERANDYVMQPCITTTHLDYTALYIYRYFVYVPFNAVNITGQKVQI